MTPQEITWVWPDTPIVIALSLALAALAHYLIGRAIARAVAAAVRRADARAESAGERPATGTNAERVRQRTQTVGSLLTSMASVIIWVVAVLTVMSVLGVPLGPVLASAGVGGVALGIGAQSLVKDFLSGVFMIVEDQYGVGDVVDTGEVSGTVEEVTLRVTRIRDSSGVIWYVRNGEIVQLGNRSQGWSTATVDLPVSAKEAPERVVRILAEAMANLAASPALADRVIGAPEVLGIESLTATTMTLRIVAKTRANENWTVQRELRLRGLEALEANGIAAVDPLPGPPPAATSP